MVGPLWLWANYRHWRCEKTFFDIFDTPYPTFPEHIWVLLTLRWFPHWRIVRATDYEACCQRRFSAE